MVELSFLVVLVVIIFDLVCVFLFILLGWFF